MELNYQKNDNTALFNSFQRPDLLNMVNVQNYIPIYDCYFSLNETNYNSINLNQLNSLQNIETNSTAFVKDNNNNISEKTVL